MTAGLCECGCGGTTGRADKTDRARGSVKGEHVRFIPGHNNRLRRMGFREDDRGFTTPCHIYSGRLTETGYPESGGRKVYRVMWEAEFGPVPAGLELDHLCRQRACVNLDHLEPVTHRENMRRSSVARAMEAAADESGIRALRVRFGWSQGDLAERLGVSRGLVCLWENGKHSIREPHLARLIALAFHGRDPEGDLR